MANPLIRALNGWRFERPLALVLGASAAFATIAMPHQLFGKIPGVTASGFERPIQIFLALLVGLVAAAAGYAAMTLADATADEDVEDEEPAGPPIDIPVRLRRADRHPDHPTRQPIRASRDLGTPFMKIRAFGTRMEAEPIPDADFVELAPLTAERPIGGATIAADGAEAPSEDAVLAASAATPCPEPSEWPLPEAAAMEADARAPIAPVTERVLHEPEGDPLPSIAASAPDPEPVTEPARRAERARRESLAEMMERLSAGLDARAGRSVGAPPAAMLAEVLARPRAARPDMRDALEELNRLASRRN